MINLLKGLEKPKQSEEWEYSAVIAVTYTEDAYLVSYEGDNRGLFEIGDELFDQGLLPPEDLKPGLYNCKDFYTTNVKYDWETGYAASWDIKCTWEYVRLKPVTAGEIAKILYETNDENAFGEKLTYEKLCKDWMEEKSTLAIEIFDHVHAQADRVIAYIKSEPTKESGDTDEDR
jgi:hypothetical protein